MKNLPKVVVVMSTYNGEKFLKTQIDSILNQKDVDVILHIFDDVSKDKTVDIAREYESKNKNVFVHINEKNKNYTYNFLDGLFMFKDNQDYDYYAFADQDDFWVQDKLITAVNKLKEMGECSLYSSNLAIVDGELNETGKTNIDMSYNHKKYDQLFFDSVTGCTAVFDKEFKNLVTKHYPEDLLYHDYWVALIATFCKDAKYYLDMNPSHILYRQHGSNASGGFHKKQKFYRLRRLFGGIEVNFKILSQLLNYFKEELDETDKVIIEKFINYKKLKNKIYLLKNLDCTGRNRFKIKLLLNRYKNKFGGK